jgi:hypothetical protein
VSDRKRGKNLMASVTVEISGDVAVASIADPLAILSNND